MRQQALAALAAILLATTASGGVARAQEAAAVAAHQVPPGAVEEFAEMRDGVKLAANVYKPAGQGPWPVILSRTPYLKDPRGDNTAERLAAQARRYTDAGYVFVLQDVRGKGRSEGFYAAFEDDIEDGYDTVEWAARQPWSNGKIGITGGAALGITANAAAMAAPPHLAAAYVVVAPTDRNRNSYMGGVLKEKDTVGWLQRQGVADEVIDMTRARVTDDVFWNRAAMSTNRKYIQIPMYNVGGWYEPNGLMLLPPSAFFIIGGFIWVLRSFKTEQVEEDN